MRLKPTPVAAALCFLGVISMPAYADSSNADNAKVISALTQRTEALEQQIQELQNEIKHLQPNARLKVTTRKGAQSGANGVYVPVKSRTLPPPLICGAHHGVAASVGTGHSSSVANSTSAAVVAPQNIADSTSTTDPTLSAQMGRAMPLHGIEEPGVLGTDTLAEIKPLSLLANAPLILGGMPVVTSPYLGVRSAFDGTDLISSLPSINEGLHLLTERQTIESIFIKNHTPLPDNPYIDLSGTVQPILTVSTPYDGPSTSTFDLPTAQLQIMGNINRWVTSFMEFSYDNTAPGQQIPAVIGPLTANSRVFLEQGFVAIGNLNCSPLYLVAGQMYVPFGKYSSAMISAPLTQNIGRVRARAALLGFERKVSDFLTVDAQAYAFRGDTLLTLSSNRINQAGANLDFTFTAHKWSGSLGGGVISNIADSLGMQLTGGAITGFSGFAGPLALFPNSELLEHRVPGVDVHGNFEVGHLNLISEFISATTDFDPENLTFNDHGAKPQAAQFEGIYTFDICDRPSNIALGYQLSRQSLALLEPERRYIATFNTSIWKDTLESLEFRHDVNYGPHDIASGQGVLITTDGLGLGHSSNTLTLQMAVYF